MSKIEKWFSRWMRHARGFVEGFLVGDRGWGFARLVTVLILCLAFMLFSSIIWEQAMLNPVVDQLQNLPVIGLIPRLLLMVVVALFKLSSLRYLIIPFSALIGAVLVGARYVQDIYELKSYRAAISYLIASMFGIAYPDLVIEDGKKQIRPDEENLLDKIGGPGYVIIRPGSVVLFEQLHNPSAVRSAGEHFVSRFETIKEIIPLQDQHAYIEKLMAVTKDGVIVTAKDIHYRYRLYAHRRKGQERNRSTKVPYPYSEQAVRNMAYNRAVRQDGYTSWTDTVRILFEGEIQSFIRQNQIDQVTAPRQENVDPRQDIHRLYDSPNFRERFRNIGAQLLWYGIGHFEVSNERITNQRIRTWQAGWRGDADVLRAYSEGIEGAYRELGKAQAKAKILNSFYYELDRLLKDPENRETNVRDLFIERIADLLEAMQMESSIE